MPKLRTTTTAIGVTALLAIPVATVLTASPASAVDKEGNCAGARYELDVEKDDGRFEVDADIDDARAGSKWRVTLKHDGKRFYNKVRTADREGDISVDRYRPDTAGKDVFKLTVKKIGSGSSCSHTITLR